jgi:hypothetical protein
MVDKPKKPAQQKSRRRSARRAARRRATGRIDQLVGLQQRAIHRYADLYSSVANKIVAGDFNISKWTKDYSTAWSDAAEDASEAAKILLQAPAAKVARKKDKRKSDRSEEAFWGWLSLQQSFLSRLANYYRTVGQLVTSGSMELREYFQSGAEFWSDVTADIGDWTRVQAGKELRPTSEWLPRVRKQVRQGKLADHIRLEVPMDVFPNDATPDPKVTLFTDGLCRVGGGITLAPNQHVSFNPPQVHRSSPVAELQLHDLPRLTQGEVYTGVVSVKETKAAVAAVEIEIV